jgi:hypothetical protein
MMIGGLEPIFGDCWKLKKSFSGFIFLIFLHFATANFPGCDHFQALRVGVNYQIYSPNFHLGQLYPRSTRCRWTAEAPPGFKVNINCDVFDLPSVRFFLVS